ncbi:lipocalin family protein [uncultured Kriegella sp.]|uniref:lipocalin family protein n=1 Tax=uncultured Kriegella sp. TaxID=1798910 RepID=UPI0030DCCC44|tara:strand:+ start:200466 stop:200963 length:498 start_codon:yes stop_codon:yes gene_type:complete
MRYGAILLMVFSVFLFSCSSDKEDETMEVDNSIVGTWQATELKIDNETAGDDAKFGKQILDILTGNDCYIIAFTFNDDQSVVAENSVNYLEFNASSTGQLVPCPTEKDSDAGTYTFENSLLTIADSEGDIIEVSVVIDGDIMTLDAGDLDVPNFNSAGELVFERK